MAKTNYRGYLKQELVPVKKYFYVLRALLAVRWIEKYREPAPIVFDTLRGLVIADKALDEAVSALLESKRISREKEIAPRIPVLNDFIESELARLENYRETYQGKVSGFDALNSLFHRALA